MTVGLKLNTDKCIQRYMVALINVELQRKLQKQFFGLTIKRNNKQKKEKACEELCKVSKNKWILKMSQNMEK